MKVIDYLSDRTLAITETFEPDRTLAITETFEPGTEIFKSVPDDWSTSFEIHLPSEKNHELKMRRFALRMYRAVQLLAEVIDIDPDRRGGIPVLKDTRFKASQILAQFADGDSISDLESELELDAEAVRSFLRALSVILDQPHVGRFPQ